MFPKNPLVLMQLAEDQSRSFRRESEKQRMLERPSGASLPGYPHIPIEQFPRLVISW